MLRRNLLCLYQKKLFLSFYACFCLTAAAQYRIDQWTADDGLPQNSVYGIVQTRDGYLWLATVDGLARFDGVKFTVFNKSNSPGIVNNRFVSLSENADGDLWAGTEESGVVRLHDGRFAHFMTGDATGDAASVNWIGDGGASDGAVLALAGNEKTMRFENGEFRPFDERANSAENVRPIRRQSVRAYCNFRLPINIFGCYADGRWLDFSPAPGEPEYKLRTAARDADGNFWLLTESRELVRVENGKTVRVCKEGDGLPGIPLDFVVGAKTSLVSWDGRDSLLLTDLETMKSELLAKTPANLPPATGDIYPPFTENESVFRSSYQDAEGNLWFGTLRGGLYRARKQVVKTFSSAEGLTDTNVYPIYETNDGSLLVGTTNGLFSFDGDRFAPVASAEKFYVQAIGKNPAGQIVISELYHLYVRQGNDLIPFLVEQFPVGYGVYTVYTDRENHLWIGNEKGLYRFGDGAATVTFTTENGLAGNDVKTIIDAKNGGVWIGTYGGLSLYKDGKLMSWTESEGLPSRTIRALYEDSDGALWIGTYDGGLARFKDGKFTAYNSKIGLYTDEAFQILEDGNRNFWISSNHGIYRVNKNELNDYADGKRQTITSVAYGKADGMLNAECNGGRSPAGIKTKDGRLWFPTQDGVAMINPRDIKINSQPPPVVIETVKVDNQMSEPSTSADSSDSENRVSNSNGSLTAVQPSAIADGSDMIINPNQQNFEIGYTALSFINSENLRFKYQLEGLDTDWVDAGTRRLAYFSHVPPGNYTFRVIAANADGVWNETGASLQIKVMPPFYRTWWFSILTVLAIGVVILLLYRRRINKLEKERLAQADFSRRLLNAQETERRRVAGELHDSIGQSLAMIKNTAVFGRQTVGNVAEAKEHLAEISGASAQAIAEVREIAYNLRPFMLDRLGLTKSISSLLNKIADNSQLKIHSEIENIDGTFESEAEISVYRIIQECFNNILKHSEAREVKVKLAKSERAVSILISDDGKGFDAKNHDETNRTGGFGLIGISERVRILGGTTAIDSAVGAGTIVKIVIWRHK